MSTTNMKDFRKLAEFATKISKNFSNTHCIVISPFLYIPLCTSCCTVYISHLSYTLKSRGDNT